jgi:hypothetical protein
MMKNIFKILSLTLLLSYAFQSQAEDAKRFLTKSEQAVIAEYLVDNCADSFCGGDYHFSNIGIYCDEQCTISYDVAAYKEEHYFTPNQFYSSADELRDFSLEELSLKLYKPRSFDDHYYGLNGELIFFINLKVSAKCKLNFEYDYGLTFAQKRNLIYREQQACAVEISKSMHDIQASF